MHDQTVSHPLKEGHHFEQSLGGVAGLFENIRANTQVEAYLPNYLRLLADFHQGIAHSHLEAEKNLKGSVLPILGRLHSEIKNKSKELNGGAGKGSKAVATARNTTQKHIELLGQYTGSFEATGGRVEPHNDPYVIQRGIQHRLHRQILEENNNRQDLIAVQESFRTFEGHVIQTIQQAMTAFLQIVGGQADRQKSIYSDMVGTAQRIPLDFEWSNFLHRNSSLMLDPNAPPRTLSNITYPNQDHHSTRSLISGTLERKSRGIGALAGYKSGHYAVTAAKYLHQFDDDDNLRKDPTPELSLYLPDCTVGAVSGEMFNIKGKDVSKGKVGGALSLSHEFAFKAHTPTDAGKWWTVIMEASGAGGLVANASSPIEKRNVSGQSVPPAYEEKSAPPLQTQGLPQGHGQPSAGPKSGGVHSAGPQSAVTPTSGYGGLQSAGPPGAGAGGYSKDL